jgi:hypothetical protein
MRWLSTKTKLSPVVCATLVWQQSTDDKKMLAIWVKRYQLKTVALES